MTSIHQELHLPAKPARIFDAYMDAKEHATFTGGGATSIDPSAGGAFSFHGGVINGRNIELVPGKRIVQAWRVGNWPEGVYSIVRIELAPDGDGTKLVLDHTGYPEDQGKHLDQGWHARYWEPLRKHLA